MLNPWAWLQYAHNMSGAVITGAFVMAAVGAFYLLSQKHVEQGRIFVRTGRDRRTDRQRAAAFPNRRCAGRMVAAKQPVTLGRDGGAVRDAAGAPLVILGQPNVADAEDRQPDRRSQDAELPDLAPLERRGARA